MSIQTYLSLLLLVLLPAAFSTSKTDNAVGALLNRLDSKRASESVQESAAQGVLQRLLPSYLHSFQFQIVSKVSSFMSLLPNLLFLI